MKTILYSSLLILPLAFISCIKKTGVENSSTPDAVVKNFVNLSAGAQNDGDRDRLLKLCSGEMRRAFERMTPEAFKIAYLNSTVKIKEMTVLESKAEGDNASIVYEVSIENAQGLDTTKEINKRRVELVKSQGAWLIESIRPEGSDKIAFTRGMIF